MNALATKSRVISHSFSLYGYQQHTETCSEGIVDSKHFLSKYRWNEAKFKAPNCVSKQNEIHILVQHAEAHIVRT